MFLSVATRRDTSSGTLANALHLPALFVDIDFEHQDEAQARRDLATFALPPSAIIASGHGLQTPSSQGWQGRF